MTTVWYERKEIKDELVVFGRAIQGIAPYRIVIEPDPAKCRSGVCSFSAKEIVVNPTMFAGCDIDQYQLTKALLVHEAGHRRYTYMVALPIIVSAIANILEDERVESRMWDEFVGVRWLITKLAARFHQEAMPIDGNSDLPHEVVSYFLQLRWAKRINGSVKGGLSKSNYALWTRVEPLVYESWQASSSDTVSRNAAIIADILSLDNRNIRYVSNINNQIGGV